MTKTRKIAWPREFPGVHYYDSKEEKAVVSVLRKGAPFRYYGMTPPRHVAALEEAAKKFYGKKYSMAVNSGTGALFTAMAALGIGPGDEVIVPAFFWVSTVGSVVAANAIPVLCEINDTFNMDPADLEKKIAPRTKLIVPVHMAGAPADMKNIMPIAEKHGIAVLEDCAQCNGGSVGGKKVGTFGRIGMFSFQLNKNCTPGEGGLLVTDDRDLHVRINAAHDVGVPWVNGGPDAGAGVALWGSGRRMGELAGAVANVQFKKLPAIIRHMRESKQRIKAALKGVEGLGFRRIVDDKGDTGCFLILVLKDQQCAETAAAHMREQGLPASQINNYGLHIYYNIPQLVQKAPLSPAGNPWSLPQNAGSIYDYARGACPRSDALFARSVIIPVPSCLTKQQEASAARIIAASLGC